EFDEIIINLQNSDHGGYWNEKEGVNYYQSKEEALGWTIGFMHEHQSWGLYTGWAQSPRDIISRSNTRITPDLVEGFFRQYWRGEYNISAAYAPNSGFNVASTQALDINVGDVTITYVNYLKMVSLLESGSISRLDGLKLTGIVNDAFGISYSSVEAITGGGIILTNKLSGNSNLMKGVKIIRNVPAIGLVGTTSDALDVALDFYNKDIGKGFLKAGVLILKNTIRFSSPMGFALITLIDLSIAAYDIYNDVND